MEPPYAKLRVEPLYIELCIEPRAEPLYAELCVKPCVWGAAPILCVAYHISRCGEREIVHLSPKRILRLAGTTSSSSANMLLQ